MADSMTNWSESLSLMFSTKRLDTETEAQRNYNLFRDYSYDYNSGMLIPNSWVNGLPPVYEAK